MFNKIKYRNFMNKLDKFSRNLSTAMLRFNTKVEQDYQNMKLTNGLFFNAINEANLLLNAAMDKTKYASLYQVECIQYTRAAFDAAHALCAKYREFLNAVIIRNDYYEYRNSVRAINADSASLCISVMEHTHDMAAKVSDLLSNFKKDMDDENTTQLSSFSITVYLDMLTTNKTTIETILNYAPTDSSWTDKAIFDLYYAAANAFGLIYKLNATYCDLLIYAMHKNKELEENKQDNTKISENNKGE